MKKRSLLIVVALLCMASLMAAMAYSKATVTNNADLTVVNTNEALLSFKLVDTSKIGLKDGAASIVDGNLVFDFDKGNGSTQFGLQKNSVYEWYSSNPSYGLFKIRNNSKEFLDINIKAVGVPKGVDVYILECHAGGLKVPNSTWVQIDTENGYDSNQGWQGGSENDFGIRIVVREDAELDNYNGIKLVVNAVADESYDN